MRQTFVAVGMLFLVSSVGCATMQGFSARQQYIEAQARAYVFEKPAAEVLPAARQLLFEKGYEVKNSGEGGALTVESEWKYEGKRRSRYLMQVNPVDASHCKVLFTKMEASGDFKDTDTVRDTGTGWELIQKVDPERAAAIKAEGEKRGEAALATL